MPEIGLVDSGSFFVEEQLERLERAVEPLDIHELPDLDLDRFSGLLIPGSNSATFLLHISLIMPLYPLLYSFAYNNARR